MDKQLHMPDREEVEYVTRNFSALQGLKIVPVGVVFGVWAASEAQLLTGPVWWVLFVASVIAAVIATPLIGRWYAERYGEVEPRREVSPSTRLALLVIGVVVVAVVVLVSGARGWLPEIELVAAPGLVLGAALLAVTWAQGPVARRVHPWVHRFGVVLALVSVLPLGLVVGGGPHPLNASGVMPMLIALFLIVAGLDSHRALGMLLKGGRKA